MSSDNKKDTLHLAGFNVDSQTAGYVSTGGHMAAGVAPGFAPATALEGAAEFIDAAALKNRLLNELYSEEVAKRLNASGIVFTDTTTGKARPLTAKDLATEEGLDIALDHKELLPPIIQHQLNDADNYAQKLAKFGMETGEQLGLAVLTGGISAMAITMGTGRFTDKVHNQFLDIHEYLTPDMLADTVKAQIAAHKRDASTPVDKSLFAALIIASRSDPDKMLTNQDDMLTEYNNGELVRKVQEHMTQKAQAQEAGLPPPYTELDLAMSNLDADGAFSVLMPQTNAQGGPLNLGKFNTVSFLDIITQHVDEHNVDDILFNPEAIKQNIAMGKMVSAATQTQGPENAAQALALKEGKNLYASTQSVQDQPVGGIPAAAPKQNRTKDFSGGLAT